MAVNVSTPVTGAPQTGFTAPTYIIALDTSPDANARQWAVTALGGTQVGVIPSSVSSPFTLSVFRPKAFQQLGKPNPVTGLISRVPRNNYKVITRKGVLPLVGQPITNMGVTTLIEVPAGADVADQANVRAALSLHIGALQQVAAGMGDTVVQGVL